MDKPPVTLEQIYKGNRRFSEGVTLDEKNQFVLSQELTDDGWEEAVGFNSRTSLDIALAEVNRLKSLHYEVGIAFVTNEIGCLLKKDTLKKDN